jgi:Phosphotransferase enzyme family
MEMKKLPDNSTALHVASSLLQEDVFNCERILTGNQNIVYSVDTKDDNYIVRMTDDVKYPIAAQYWQKILIPLSIPICPFTHTDFENKHSEFFSVLMKKLPGKDLFHVYSNLSKTDKENIAYEIFHIQQKTDNLPLGKTFGHSCFYEEDLHFSWTDFLNYNLVFFLEKIQQHKQVSTELIIPAFKLLKYIDFSQVIPAPFLRDISERNVMIHDGHISGIIDVDDLGFGDKLLVIALTQIALEQDGHDTYYVDCWKQLLNLNENEIERYNYYLIYYILSFIKSAGLKTYNQQKMDFNVEKLNKMLDKAYSYFKPKYPQCFN